MADDVEVALAELAAAREEFDSAMQSAWWKPPADVSERLISAHATVARLLPDEWVVELTDLPPCDPGAPMPIVLADGFTVWLSYFGAQEPYFSNRTVVTFRHVDSVVFGGANDEALHGHRLWAKGLRPYAFHEVFGSKWIAERERENSVHEWHSVATFARLRHFVFTFHDQTFECLAHGFAHAPTGLADVIGGLDPSSTTGAVTPWGE